MSAAAPVTAHVGTIDSGHGSSEDEGPTRRGRAIELLLTGGATFLLFPLAILARRVFGLEDAELAAGISTFYAAHLINDPHFAVTYFLFYRNVRGRLLDTTYGRAQRARYAVSGFVVPVVLAAWAAWAIASRSAQTLGWMIQLMFLLVGWHYVKQGFGALSVLLARRGQSLTPRERTVVLAHCFLAWAYAWASPAVPSASYEERGVVYTQIAHPRWFEVTTRAALVASSIALAWTLVAKWWRDRSAFPEGDARATFPLGPLACFLVTVWAWTIYASLDPVMRYFIPALHSIQYLYFVWLMRRNEARAEEGPPTFGGPVKLRLGVLALGSIALGFLLFHGGPAFLDDALPRSSPIKAALGETPLLAVIYVFVNVHHYFMDHVIWRRENPDTRHLRSDLAPAK